ncbi:MAG: DoxX family protein [Hyphomicrobiales bacterium]|nr:DoxX family protein [Hyphomicrobiales bacterium]
MSEQTAKAPQSAATGGLAGLVNWAIGVCEMIPHWFIAFVARFSIAAVFWKSGQTKVQNFAIDLVDGVFRVGVPKLSDSAVLLFREEYRMPAPEILAPFAAFAEHLFPFLILVGLATRFSAIALLVMTLVIQIFVYPGAYPLHGTWAAILLFLIAYGPGVLSLDHLVKKQYGGT